ncbi:alpha/beta hydrolase [Mucilaginibacter gynuensis]|uniref:Alpha/beta hydrolase n=1 Tax=Mucilaginibacter gynuensis TaxID=1302236 RepID=A0ABP8GHD0_9SPHI
MKKFSYLIMLLLLVCAGASAQEADTLALPNTKLIRNIPYVANGHPQQNFDLYIPNNAKKPMPVILWIHGGAWEGGFKKWIDVAYLVGQGYAIASIDYRFSQHAIFPAQAIDCNEAIYYIWKNAAKYNLDVNRFVIGGGSAGGHLASLIGLSYNNKVKGFYNDINKSSKIRIRGVLDFYGPADFNVVHGTATLSFDYDDEKSAVTRLLGAMTLDRPDIAAYASPVTYIDKDDPPFIIFHGDKDQLVPFWESRQFYARLKLAGVKAELVKLPGVGHAGGEFSAPAMQKKVIDFLNEVLK